MPVGVVALPERERDRPTAMQAAVVARDQQPAARFTESQRDPWGWRTAPVRPAVLFWLGLLSAGIVNGHPAVDALVGIALITTPAAVLLALARRDTRAAS